MSNRVTGVVVAVASVAYVIVLGTAQTPTGAQNQAAAAQQVSPEVARRQSTAYRESGLKAAAAITGQFVIKSGYQRGGGPADLDELADLSDVVLLGEPVANICRLTQDGRRIATFFTVRVDQVVKGKHNIGDSITVVLLGGRVGFGNGTWAQMNASGIRYPDVNRSYMWFLRSASSDLTAGNETQLSRGAYEPTAGALGLYDLSSRERSHILPAGDHLGPLGRRLAKERLSAVDFVRRTTGR